MAAGGEVEAHEGIAGLQQRQKHRLVHLAAGVRLHIGEAGAEQFPGAIDRQRLHDVHPFAAAVIAVARIALGVFVGQHRALRFQHRAADDVLRRDQFDLMTLPAELAADRRGDVRIGLGEPRGKELVGRGGCLGGCLGAGRAHGRISPSPQPAGGGAVGLCGSRKRRWRDTISASNGQAIACAPGIYARYGGNGPWGGRVPN